MAKSEDGLLIVGLLVAAYFLFGQSGTTTTNPDEQTSFNPAGGDNSSGGGSLDLSGLFGGLGQAISGIGSGISSALSGITGGGKGNTQDNTNPTTGNTNTTANSILTDIGNLLAGKGLGNSNTNTSPNGAQNSVQDTNKNSSSGIFSQSPVTTGNSFVNDVDAIGNIIKGSGVTAMALGGAYLGTKLLAPVVSPVGQALGGSVPSIETGLANTGAYLTTDVSSLSVAGAAGAVGLSIGAAAAGFAIGNVFNASKAGQALQQGSANLGTAFGGSSIGQKVFGVPQVNSGAANAALKSNSATAGITVGALQSYFKKNPKNPSAQQAVTALGGGTLGKK